MKICNRCKQEKLNDQFYKDAKKGDGLYYICRQCAHKQEKKYRQLHKKEIKI